jgi:hypothetical protein
MFHAFQRYSHARPRERRLALWHCDRARCPMSIFSTLFAVAAASMCIAGCINPAAAHSQGSGSACAQSPNSRTKRIETRMRKCPAETSRSTTIRKSTRVRQDGSFLERHRSIRTGDPKRRRVHRLSVINSPRLTVACHSARKFASLMSSPTGRWLFASLIADHSSATAFLTFRSPQLAVWE